MQLTKVHVLHAELVCRSGVHIGASDSEMHIGGIDKAVVKHPITMEPYIPGSSIKGKVRSLLEWRSGFVSNGPLNWQDYVNSHSDKVLAILKLFGVGGQVLTNAQAKEIGPTRLSFWDCSLLPEWISSVRTSEGSYTEVKTENSIDRIAGTAINPRQTERVPADARFDFKVTVKVLDDENLLDTLLAGLKLLELDGIGGSVSRGYGKVKFEKLSLDGKDISADFDQIDPFAK